MKKQIGSLYQFLLTLLAIVCLIIASQMMILKVSLLSTTHWEKTTETSGYTKALTETINQGIQDLGLASGITADGLEQVIKEEQVAQDFNHFLENTLNGAPYMVKQDDIKKGISDAITAYADKTGKAIDASNQESVNDFVNQAYHIYDRSIRNKIISTFGLRINLINQASNMVLYGSLILLAVLLLFNYLAADRYTHVFVRNLAYLFSSSSMLLLLSSYLFYRYNPIRSLSIFDDNLNNWLFEGFKQPQLLNISLCGVFLVIGIGLSIFSYKSYKQLELRGFRRERKQRG